MEHFVIKQMDRVVNDILVGPNVAQTPELAHEIPIPPSYTL